MDFDFDDLISSDAANNAKAGTKFQPKGKPKPKPKSNPKTQPYPKPLSTQVIEDFDAANNEFTGRIVEDQPGNDISQISGIINDDFFEKSQVGFTQNAESLDDFLPQSTTVTVNLPPCPETPTVLDSMDENLEKESIEPDLTNGYTNFEDLAQIDPLTGEEASVFNDNGDFQIENISFDFLPQSNNNSSVSGPRVEKFKPKPKAQTRKSEEIPPMVQFSENNHSVDEILNDSAPMETMSDFHVNEDESISLAEISQMDSPIPAESPTVGTENVNIGKRLRKRPNKSLTLIDECENEGIDDDDLTHENEDNYEAGKNRSLTEKKGSNSKKSVNEKDKEKPARKRKKAASESTKVPKKKFPHGTRRNKRQVNLELLNMPQEDFEDKRQEIPMKELIRIAEHREIIAKKEASTSGTPAVNQSYSNPYDEEDQGNESEMVENATYYNYRTHMKITPRVKWTKQDTELFYEAIQRFGPDLSMINQCFPERTREQIKKKYKKEERQQPLRLSDALTTRTKGFSRFGAVFEELEKAMEEDQNQINNTSEVDEEATEINVDEDATKSEVKEDDATKSEDKDDAPEYESQDEEFDFSQYKSEV